MSEDLFVDDILERKPAKKRKKTKLPSTRTLEALREMGYRVQIVERWNPFANVRVDLFGVIDAIAVKPGIILGVQATVKARQPDHRRKCLAEPALKDWLEAGGKFQIWGWRKLGGKGKQKRWEPSIEEITLEDFNDK